MRRANTHLLQARDTSASSISLTQRFKSSLYFINSQFFGMRAGKRYFLLLSPLSSRTFTGRNFGRRKLLFWLKKFLMCSRIKKKKKECREREKDTRTKKLFKVSNHEQQGRKEKVRRDISKEVTAYQGVDTSTCCWHKYRASVYRSILQMK